MQSPRRRAFALAAWFLLLVLPGCPSKSEPPKESTKTEPAPMMVAPSASAPPPVVAPSASASASALAPSPPSPESQDIDPETVTALLVWQKDERARGKFRTQWVERQGDKPHVVDEKPGILFISSTSLWTLEFTIVKGCPENASLPNGSLDIVNGVPQQTRPDMEMPELTNISDGQRVAPWKDGHGYPFMGTQCEPIEDYGVDIVFDGGMGPFVVVRVRTYENYGGAHGIHGESVYAIDLEKRAKVKLQPRAEDRPALIANAAKGLEVKNEEVQPNGTLLMYGPNGTGLAIYRYWSSASYAGGNGGNSYSSDFEVSSKGLPVDVARYGRLPAWALPLLKPKSIPIFMVPPARKELFKSQFDNAYVRGNPP